jgi:nicotinate-nucleotide--dimethylbenzimidazole phosphoribosyltransferase
VILDGVVAAAAATVAHEIAPSAAQWWLAGHISPEPAHRIALERLGLEPMLDLGMRLGEGTGALAALPLLRGAVRTLSEMSTFDAAAVWDRPRVAGPGAVAGGPTR